MSESQNKYERIDIHINPAGAPAHNSANRHDGTIDAWFVNHSQFPLQKLREHGGAVLATFPLRYLIKATVSGENLQICLDDLSSDDDVRRAAHVPQAAIQADFNDWH